MLDRVGEAVVGKREPLRLVLAGILARGHVLLEDVPGVGKTLTARSFAQALGIDVPPGPVHARPAAVRRHRVVRLRPAHARSSCSGPARSSPGCCSPTRSTGRRRRPRPRCSKRCRSARSPSRARRSRSSAPFHVLATANPVEYEGTYPLPEAQLDRFLLRVPFGYPTPEEEWVVLGRRIDRRQEEQVVEPVTDAVGLLQLQRACEDGRGRRDRSGATASSCRRRPASTARC